MYFNLIGNICLSDIPKDLIRTGKNGKKYLDIYIGQRRQVSQYGHTHFIKAYVPRDRREEGVEFFIGDAKPSEYQTQQSRVMAGAEAYVREQQQGQYRQQAPPPAPAQAKPPRQSSFTQEDESGDLPF